MTKKQRKRKKRKQQALQNVMPEQDTVVGDGGRAAVRHAAVSPPVNSLPSIGASPMTRKSIHRNMLQYMEQRLLEHERNDIDAGDRSLDDAEYQIILDTLRNFDDEDVEDSNTLPKPPMLTNPIADTGEKSLTPRLLTGGFPCSFSPESPTVTPTDVVEFSHAGYDGGVVVGFDGTWDDYKFERLIETLEEAKERAGDAARDGLEGFAMHLDGQDILVTPTGGRAGGSEAKGGVIYKYRFFCQGVEFMIHSKPSKHIQPVRIRYGAESVQGHRDKFFNVHFGFVLPFLKILGLTVTEDKLSRVDMQCLIDISVDEFIRLLREKHVVTKLRKKAEYGTMTRVETLEIGSLSNVQFCFYDKGRQHTKLDLIKAAMFIRDCVGDEWYNSNRPITRIEIRLGRDFLRCVGVSSVADLQKREQGIIELLTTEWLRILEKPKVRGCEATATIHPIWERVRNLFFAYFTGNEVEVEYKKHESLVCDPEALEKQALGCLSAALAVRHGEQDYVESSEHLGNIWIRDYSGELHAKINKKVVLSRHKTGIEFGASPGLRAGHNTELEPSSALEPSVIERKKAQTNTWIASLSGSASKPQKSLLDSLVPPTPPPLDGVTDAPRGNGAALDLDGATSAERFGDFMKKIEQLFTGVK